MALGGDRVGGVVDVGVAVAVVVLADRLPGIGHELGDPGGAGGAGGARVPSGLLRDLGGDESGGDAVAHGACGVDQVAVLGRYLVGRGSVAGGGLGLVEQGDDPEERQERCGSGGDVDGDLLHGFPRFGGK